MSLFQSTHPRGVRHVFCVVSHVKQRRFNPRTRVGCDVLPIRTRFLVISFNPRTRVGCDQAACLDP